MMTKKTKRNPIDVSYDLNTIIDSLRTLAKVSYASGTDGRSSYGVLEPTPDDVLLLVSDSLFSIAERITTLSLELEAMPDTSKTSQGDAV